MPYMNKSTYDTRLTSIMRSLRNDLAHNRISEKEFEILLGLLIEIEFDRSIQHKLSHILPKPKQKRGMLNFMNYEWKHTHVRG